MFKHRLALVALVVLQSPQAGKPSSSEYNDDVASSILNAPKEAPDVVHEDGHDFIVITKNDLEQVRPSHESDFEGSGFDLTEDAGPKIESTDNCLEPGYSKVCSGKGKCLNNGCVCDSFEYSEKNETVRYRHSGKFCEECPYCRGQRCSKFLACANCVLTEVEADCSLLCPFLFSKMAEITRNVDNDEKICEIENKEGCFFRLKYFYNDQNLLVVEFETQVWCFNGKKFLLFVFWTVVGYILLLMVCVPRIFPVHYRPTSDIVRRGPRKPVTADVVRFEKSSFN